MNKIISPQDRNLQRVSAETSSSPPPSALRARPSPKIRSGAAPRGRTYTGPMLKFERRNAAGLKVLRNAYHVLRHDDEEGFVTHRELPSIVLDRGRLTVGSVPILNARFSADCITWVQQSPGRYTSGHLYVYAKGMSIHGVVHQGTSRTDAVRHDFIGTTVKPVTYRTSITKQPYPRTQDPSSIPSSGWVDGLDLVIGYELQIGGTVPVPLVSLGGQDISPYTTWSVAANGKTVLIITLDDGACDLVGPQFYKAARLIFDPYVPVPSGDGTVSATCGVAPPDSGVFFWKTTAVAEAAHAVAPMALERISHADLIEPAGDLTIADLMTILPSDTVDQDANDMLMRNMKWAMAQDSTEKDWLGTFLGETAPSVDEPGEISLIQKSLSWYQNDFAKAYLTQAFQNYSGPNAPDHKLDSGQAAKLDAWFKTGLAKTADFTVQHRGIYVDAFRRVNTTLDDYINDGKEKWTKALFDTLTNGPQFVLMVNRVHGAAGDQAAMTPLNNFATLLTALEPTAETATAYYKAVLTGIINKIGPATVHSDRDTILQWLPKAMEELLRHFADGNIPDGVEISQQEAKAMLEEYLKHQAEVCAAMADLMQAAIASDLLKQAGVMEDGFANIAARWPKLAKMTKLMFAIGWIGSVATILATLIKGDWSKMTDVQKAQFVTEIAQSAIQGYDAVPMIYNGVKNFSLKDWTQWMKKANAPEAQVEMQEIGQRAAGDEDLLEVAVNETMPLLKAGAAEASGFARVFAEGIVSGVVKILGALAAVAMAGYSLWQLIKDVDGHGSVSTVVFDALILTANAISAACLLVGLFSASALFPLAGAVAAIVGVVLSMLAAFFEKPANPVDDFMKDVGIPFVDTLPAA